MSPRPRRARTAPAALALLLLVLATCVSGCPCVRGVVNASDSLRWFLFANFGAQRLCPELLDHGGVTLHMSPGAPGTGRFFPTQCAHRVDDQSRTITVDLTGTGYAFVSPARRVGFACTVSVEYRPDFQLTEDEIYVWARLSRIVSGPDFRLGYAENPVVDAATNVGPLGLVANAFGREIVSGELTRGFTVVHDPDKGNQFALGILVPPQKPFRPYDVSEDDAFTFANETVQIVNNQRDYLGPFEVVDDDQKLSLKLDVRGPNGLDVFVMGRSYGDAWREAYQTGQDASGPPGPAFQAFSVPPGFTRREIELPRGLWYVVVDNTSRAGPTSPATSMPVLNSFWDSSVQLSYVVQLIE